MTTITVSSSASGSISNYVDPHIQITFDLVMVTDVDTSPCITAVIDWEFSGPDFATSFAQYPFFIVDHPMWKEDHLLHERNIRDQATFDELLLEAELSCSSVSGPLLSRLISESYPIYLFQQIMQFPMMGSYLYPHLFTYVFGDDENFSTDYNWGLTEGILKRVRERFDKENKVWLEAREILGIDVVGDDPDMSELRKWF